jgi:hypothetical protein
VEGQDKLEGALISADDNRAFRSTVDRAYQTPPRFLPLTVGGGGEGVRVGGISHVGPSYVSPSCQLRPPLLITTYYLTPPPSKSPNHSYMPPSHSDVTLHYRALPPPPLHWLHVLPTSMIMDSNLIDIFWTQAVHTTVHIQNIVMLRNNTDKTPYELWKGRPTNVKHFRVFGSKCYIKREDGRMGKVDSCVDKGILFGYSSTRKAYKCYNIRLNKVVESINLTIDEIGRP